MNKNSRVLTATPMAQKNSSENAIDTPVSSATTGSPVAKASAQIITVDVPPIYLFKRKIGPISPEVISSICDYSTIPTIINLHRTCKTLFNDTAEHIKMIQEMIKTIPVIVPIITRPKLTRLDAAFAYLHHEMFVRWYTGMPFKYALGNAIDIFQAKGQFKQYSLPRDYLTLQYFRRAAESRPLPSLKSALDSNNRIKNKQLDATALKSYMKGALAAFGSYLVLIRFCFSFTQKMDILPKMNILLWPSITVAVPALIILYYELNKTEISIVEGTRARFRDGFSHVGIVLFFVTVCIYLLGLCLLPLYLYL